MELENSFDYIAPVAIGTLLIIFLISFIIYFIVSYQRSQRRFIKEKAKLKEELLQAEIEIREQTFTNVSRELHDNIGQIASLIKVNLNMISNLKNPEDKEFIDQSKDLISDLIKDIKSISYSLNSKNLEEIGLVAMIERDVQRINRSQAFQLKLENSLGFLDFNNEKSKLLYRMSQEIFSNMLQHSKASKASLTISKMNDKVTFKFYDNGVGFSSSERDSKKGSGLSNLRARCQIIGADIEIKSEPGNGTEISIVTTQN